MNLGEPKNRLDEIAEDLKEIVSQVTLQASVMRSRLKRQEHEADKRCYAEDDEDDFCDKGCLADDDGATFELARAVGRIEGRAIRILHNRLFEYDEDELQGYTHEQIYTKIQTLYEEVRDMLEEFENL